MLLFCLCLTCCQYKRVSNKYEAIRQTSVDSEIVQKNKKVVKQEERPRKRGGNNDNEGDTELGDLDVDFA